MFRDLTTPINRRQGIAALLAMAGLAAPVAAGAKKKGKGLAQACQYDGQCKKVNGRCAIPAFRCSAKFDVCCRDEGMSCRNDCDCCYYNSQGEKQICSDEGMCYGFPR